MKLLFAAILLFCAPLAQAAISFTGLGYLPGGTSSVSTFQALSYDGTVAAGTSTVAGVNHAYRWTSATGMVDLGFLPGGFNSSAWGISENGEVISGTSVTGIGSEQFMWTSSGGMTSVLGIHSFGQGISADGTTFSGQFGAGGAYVHSASLGTVPLLATGSSSSVSADGSVVVGWDASPTNQLFRWTQSGGTVLIPLLPGDDQTFGPQVSRDGSTIVSFSGNTVSGLSQAVMWTSGTGLVGLGGLPGATSSALNGISNDLSLAVGRSTVAGVSHAVIWDSINGFQDLQDLLTNTYGLGASLTGWTLHVASSISADGTTISGRGTDPLGNSQAWIAVIPEPSTYAMLFLGCSILIVMCSHKSRSKV